MARSRNIKPSLFKNELLGVADPMVTILFTSLWCLADKLGRVEDRPLRIKAETFPYRDSLDINGYLTVLAQLGFIHRYQSNGISVIQIINFDKHQNPHHTEKDSCLPEYTTESTTSVITVKQPLNNGASTVNVGLIPDSLTLIPDTLIKTNTPPKQMPSPSGVCTELWADYMALRKTKKSPMTKTALSGLERECNKAGLSLEAGIRVCCERGWASLKAEWLDDKKLTVHQQQMQAFARGIGLGRSEPEQFYQHETLQTVNEIPQLEDHDHEQF